MSCWLFTYCSRTKVATPNSEVYDDAYVISRSAFTRRNDATIAGANPSGLLQGAVQGTVKGTATVGQGVVQGAGPAGQGIVQDLPP